MRFSKIRSVAIAAVACAVSSDVRAENCVRTYSLPLIAVLLTCALCYASQARSWAQDHEDSRGTTSTQGRGSVELALPPPNAYELGLFFTGLIDDANSEFHDQVLAAESSLEVALERRLASIRERSESVVASGGAYSDPEVAIVFQRLIDDRNDFVRQFIYSQRDAILRLAHPLDLTEEEKEIVELRRLRWVHSAFSSYPPDLVPARVDLNAVLSRCGVRESDLFNDAPLREAVVGYLGEVTAMREDWLRLRLRASARDAVLYHENGGVNAEFLQARETRNRRRMRVERLIVEASEDWAERIALTLPDSIRESFERDYAAKAYPPVFPNPYSFREVIAELEADDDGAEVRIELLGILRAMAARCGDVEAQMKRLCLDKWEEYGLRRAGRFPGVNVLLDAMAPFDSQRRAIAEEVSAHIRRAQVEPPLESASLVMSRLDGTLPDPRLTR